MMLKKRCNQRGQGLPLQVVVLIILAVLALVVIALIFSGSVFKGKKEIEYVSAPIEYQTACLHQDKLPYTECVEKCKKWVADHPGEHLKNAVVDGVSCYLDKKS
ncbi:hypothetical protein KY335_04750 [Candidatus Woesearchaeota archaeon]|nr:hypothetical protein [Candidatus Woesearchaeota archaeon]MBW3014517.1 hypothetical protein [Candidatus Woesearchaeota archaeon]